MNILWTDKEWQTLSELTWRIRKNNPALPLVTIVNKAQSCLPTDRRRKITASQQIGPVLAILEAMDTTFWFKSEQADLTPTKDEMLNNLTDREVAERFGERVRRFLGLIKPETIATETASETTIFDLKPDPVKPRKPKLYLYGVSHNKHQSAIRQQYTGKFDLVFATKPKSHDAAVMIWTAFLPAPGIKAIRNHNVAADLISGGISTLIERLNTCAY